MTSAVMEMAWTGEELAELARTAAGTFCKEQRRLTPSELTGAAWEGANAAAKRLRPGTARLEQAAFLSRAARNGILDYLRRETQSRRQRTRALPLPEESLDRHEAPTAGPGEFEVLQSALDEAGVTDSGDRAAALAAWAGGDPVEEHPAITEKRLARVRRKLRGVL